MSIFPLLDDGDDAPLGEGFLGDPDADRSLAPFVLRGVDFMLKANILRSSRMRVLKQSLMPPLP